MKGWTKTMQLRERDIERALALMVKRHGGLCLKWTCPGWSGVPDRIILLPDRRLVFAETKRPKGGRIQPMQQWWADKLTELGFCHRFIFDQRDIDDLEDKIVRGKWTR